MEDWQFLVGVAVLLVSVWLAAWGARGKIASEARETRRESTVAHKEITENINRVDAKIETSVETLRREAREDRTEAREGSKGTDAKIDALRESVDAKIDRTDGQIGDLRKSVDARIDGLSVTVNDTRSIVERIDTTLKERAPK